jgi:hypothetical protein
VREREFVVQHSIFPFFIHSHTFTHTHTHTQIPFEHKEKVTKKMMSFLRTIYATTDELMAVLKKKVCVVSVCVVSVRWSRSHHFY